MDESALQLAQQTAHVALVGLGGIGSPVLQYLAAAGVGSLTLIDDDVVETSLEEWKRLHAVNVEGVFLGTRAAIPLLTARATRWWDWGASARRYCNTLRRRGSGG